MQLSQCFLVDESLLDSLGHVNYLEHQRLVNRVHEAMLADAGASIAALGDRGCALFMRSVDVRYERPLKLGDTVTVTLSAHRRSRTALAFRATLSVGEAIASRVGYEMVACDNLTGKPRRLPEPFDSLPDERRAR
jgi:acyl-CoA thioesterase FadM